MPIVFGDIEGTTVRLVVNTAKGNENSKAKQEERNKVVLYWPTLNIPVHFKQQ